MLVNKDSTFIIILINVHYQMIMKNKKQKTKWKMTKHKQQKTKNNKSKRCCECMQYLMLKSRNSTKTTNQYTIITEQILWTPKMSMIGCVGRCGVSSHTCITHISNRQSIKISESGISRNRKRDIHNRK